MPKVSDRYLEVTPWEVIENGFDPQRGRVSESIFSLANEYMGVRGFFDEGYSGDSLVGAYLNGVSEEAQGPTPQYLGIPSRFVFMVNTVNWLYTRLKLDGETLDLAKSSFSGYKRTLDFKSGKLTREMTWNAPGDRQLKLKFERLISMTSPQLGCQRITIEPINFSGDVEVELGLDFSIIHESHQRSYWSVTKKALDKDIVALVGRTHSSGQSLFAGFETHIDQKVERKIIDRDHYVGSRFMLKLTKGEPIAIDKMVTIYAEKNARVDVQKVWADGAALAQTLSRRSFDEVEADSREYWAQVWKKSDIVIDGDPENQQGIRYCIFQLHQTYHGSDPTLNIGAKGLTGEAYSGHAFWDTETYCLPFYIFNNPHAARNLLEFRYNTLRPAMERAKELDCAGAMYPIATLDGTESCGAWQHANLQIQPSTAVAYGIWHYVKTTGDKEFLYGHGAEMLVEVCRLLSTRGGWGPRTGEYGFYGVMGPDEFQMMVNNNCYTNYMAKKTFEQTLNTVGAMRADAPGAYAALVEKTGLTDAEVENWIKMAARMRVPFDKESMVYEQHDGFFDLPHIDIHSIPVTDFPLYHHWSYDRIYRNDVIKQPDVLMFMFLYNREFSEQEKRANYEYYEPRCIHESSLSPSIHSVLASELGKHDEAFNFFSFATRMDLDNYNRNTREGLHTTSIAAAWVNIVYGFGGMRSDGDMIEFAPSIPAAWNSYSFHILCGEAVLGFTVDKEQVRVKSTNGKTAHIKIYGTEHNVNGGITVSLRK